MVINHNVAASKAAYYLSQRSFEIQKSTERLSSGLRLYSPSEDPGAIGQLGRLSVRVSAVDQAVRNTQGSYSLAEVAYDALTSIADIISRVKVLALQSADAVYTDAERTAMQEEVQQLVGRNAPAVTGELDSIVSGTTFNGNVLLNGTFSETFQIGPDASNTATLTINNVDTTVLGGAWTLGNGLAAEHVDVSTQANATAWLNVANGDGAIDTFDVATNEIATEKGKIAALMSRLEHNEGYLSLYSENLQSAVSAIGDVDFASELVNFSRLKLLMQAGTAILAQANVLPESVLKLLE